MLKTILTVLALLTSTQALADSIKFVSYQDVVETKTNIKNQQRWDALGSYNLMQDGANATMLGFCVDPFQETSSSYQDYTVSSLDATDFTSHGAIRLNYVQKLFDNAYSSIAGDNYKSAGFHLALWEIFHDNGNLNSGVIGTVNLTAWQQFLTNFGYSFDVTDPTVVANANDFLASLANWNVTNAYDLTFYEHGTYQNYLTATPSAVPVPAALPLFVSGLVGLGIMRRRKTNTL